MIQPPVAVPSYALQSFLCSDAWDFIRRHPNECTDPVLRTADALCDFKDLHSWHLEAAVRMCQELVGITTVVNLLETKSKRKERR